MKQTNLLVEQWTTASVEEGFSEGHGGKRQCGQVGLSEQQRFHFSDRLDVVLATFDHKINNKLAKN